jgi:hypothetical protein
MRGGFDIDMNKNITWTIIAGVLIVAAYYFYTTNQIARGQGNGQQRGRSQPEYGQREYPEDGWGVSPEGSSCEEEWDRRHREWEKKYGDRQRREHRPRYSEED